MHRRVGVVVVLVALVGCTTARVGNDPATVSPPSPSAEALTEIPRVEPGGAPSLHAAIRELCVPPSIPSGTPPSGSLPPDLVEIAHQLEIARGHDFTTLPAAEAITNEEMDRRLAKSFASYYPKALYDRRTFAWRTIGVIGPRDDLYEAYSAFFAGEVVGYYDPDTGELVYLGSGGLDFNERFTLAHELTHALDDQIFDLKRLDAFSKACQDERGEAALGLVEGSAQYFAAVTVAQDPEISLTDLLGAIAGALTSGQPPPGVPPFLDALELWPYVDGEAFVEHLAGGGTDAVDRAFEDLPVSTEQVIHPERYPTDRPRAVAIPDLTGVLGPHWGDLDAMTIGEEWLRAMLALRLDADLADDAAAGWDGGAYRAFTDGRDVAVVLRTAWDTPADAEVFLAALQRWAAGSELIEASVDGAVVTGVFASSPGVRDAAVEAIR
jgi:hypothetical protein